MSHRPLLERAAGHAATYLDGLAQRPVNSEANLAQLRDALGGALPEEGTDDADVVDDLVRDVEPGLLGSAGGRFFGWVVGGGVPAALAADWLTSAWDQNAVLHASGPAEAVVEEVAGAWLVQLLGLPDASSFAFTTGAQQAHVTALAAARSKLLGDRGWDVDRRGLAGAPAVRVLTSELRHASIERAVRLLGMGTDCLHATGSDARGRIDLDALRDRLAERDAPSIVCLQAGEINTGAFDDFAAACGIAHEHGAWVHVDGAFGLWAAASERYRHLLSGVEQADSWTADGHKWLNVPFDCGFAFVRHPEPHRCAMSTSASYLVHAEDTPGEPARDQIDWTPEWSRRGRGVPVYAAIRALGRRGIAELVDRCCDHAHRLTTGIGALDGAQLLVAPRINQGLVRFLATDGDDHDARTDEVIERVQRSGQAWFGGTTWNGVRAMRVSVVNWQTGEQDVTRAIAAVRDALRTG